MMLSGCIYACISSICMQICTYAPPKENCQSWCLRLKWVSRGAQSQPRRFPRVEHGRVIDCGPPATQLRHQCWSHGDGTDEYLSVSDIQLKIEKKKKHSFQRK